MKKVCIAGLNPAWQKVLEFAEFRNSAVNRAVLSSAMASGKGINAARAMRLWGKTVPCVFQFAGGNTGRELLDWLDNEGIEHYTCQIDGATRTCTTQLCRKTGNATELIEPSPEVSEQQVNSLKQAFLQAIPEADGLAVCGTYPPGVPEDFYAELIAEAVDSHIPVVVDSFSRVDKTLQYPVDLLKINRDELNIITGTDNVKDAMNDIFDRYQVQHLAITDGPESAWFMERRNRICCKIAIPAIAKTVNTIGSGDTCTAVTISEILCGTAPVDAFRYGLQAASANCLTDMPGVFDREKALEFFSQTEYSTQN